LLLYLLPSDASDDLALTSGDATLDLAPFLAPQSDTDGTRPALIESSLTSTVNG
jgi:hypothetical protein